jgi:RNA-binding protein
MIGKKGLSENLSKELDAALLAHELVKVKFLESASEDLDAYIAELCKGAKAELVESRGHIATIYRRHPEKPKIEI